MSDEKLRVAHMVYARAHYVECPHCEHHNDGWLGDPRDTETTCDECGKQYKVAADAEVRLT